ncbi:MAG: histidine--tRNA ligase [Caldimicrobium sp.]|nr:histidine--tRNA ligase [Caldimicrobium sp.]MCX7873831.1 histidine--tRNA ligase [Caldimicrobium sp.]MDW8094299.1 histidine--tRNA ligase [Caldimicrobium sp.]
MTLQAVRGFKDWLPEDCARYHFLIELARNYLERANFKEIKIPILEKTELFLRSIGEVTDIVQKETYTFQDRSQEFLTLRPEATAGICRMIIEQGLYVRPKPLRFFFIGPMFRHERPQRGRLREFYQIDVELLGQLTPYYEVELLDLALKILRAPDPEKNSFTLEINSLGCRECRPEFREYLLSALQDKREWLCETCRERLNRNPLRILDCKQEGCRRIVRELKPLSEFWCVLCREHFTELTELLSFVGITFVVNPYLVRGLDYYVRTIFEIKGKGLGAQDAVCAGGRYDYLLKELGGPDLPATGFAIGLERWALTLWGEKPPQALMEKLKPEVLFIPLGREAKREGLKLVPRLREENFKVEAFFEDRSLKAMLREADKLGVKKVLILGEDELKEGVIILKDMEKGVQERIKREGLIQRLKEELRK